MAPEQFDPLAEAAAGEILRERQVGGSEDLVPRLPLPLLVVEFVLGICPVGRGVERRSLDQPGVAARAHHAGEAAGITRPVL